MGIVKKLTIQIHNWFVNCSIYFWSRNLEGGTFRKMKKAILIAFTHLSGLLPDDEIISDFIRTDINQKFLQKLRLHKVLRGDTNTNL